MTSEDGEGRKSLDAEKKPRGCRTSGVRNKGMKCEESNK